jgi:hypothetical protein
MRRSPNNCPGYPRGRLSMVKHRQLVRQVGAYGAITIKSSTDFDNMIFPTGSIFIFGSWICEADSEGNLQGCLAEARKAREEITLPTGLDEDLTESSQALWCPNQLRLRQQPVSTLCPGQIPLRGPTRVLLETNRVPFHLDSGTQHQLFKRSIRTYFRFLPRS